MKAVNGWAATRLAGATPETAAQVLVRRPAPLPWGFAYAPRGPVTATWTPRRDRRVHRGGARPPAGAGGPVSHLRIDPEIELDGPLDEDGSTRRALRAAGWRPGQPIQPASTRLIDLRQDEAALNRRCARSGAST